MSNKQAWYQEWFGTEYLELYAHRDQSEAAADIAKIAKLIPLHENQPILDLACGAGRHCLELAQRGYQVTGLDLSEALLNEAERLRLAKQLNIEYIQGDMRQSPRSNSFGTVLNLFTSFGYFEKEASNQEVVTAIAESLKPNGWFVIDYLNCGQVLANLVPEDVKQIGSKQVRQQRDYDADNKRLRKRITITDSEGSRRFEESLRIYSEQELMQMIEHASLRLEAVYGGLDGQPLTGSSARIIIVGRK